MLCLDSFFFFVCISVIDFWFAVTMRFWYSNLYVYDYFNLFIYFFKNLFILVIYFWLCWVFVVAHGLSLVVASGGYSSLWCVGFSLLCLLLLHSMGSRHAGFSSCGAWV